MFDNFDYSNPFFDLTKQAMRAPELNYHHLRLFWEVARGGGLRAAAERLQLGQPAISAQIKSLEEELGAELFDRTGRGLKLTAAGRQVMDYAGEIFGLGEELVRGLGEEGGARTLRLSLGVTQSLPKLVCWRLLRQAAHELPNLQIVCLERPVPELLGQLVSGRLDAVLADEPAPGSLRLKALDRVIDRSQVVFCATRDLAGRLRRDFPGSLQGAPVLLPGLHTAWRRELDRWFTSHRLAPRVVAEFDDAALMKTAAADGRGFVPIATSVQEEAEQRYGLEAIGPPVRCRFHCHLITLHGTQHHPALAVMARRDRGHGPEKGRSG